MIAFAVVGATVAAARQQTFKVGVDLVNFGVTVIDKQGAPIRDLKAEDFELIEKGKPQRITYFASGDAALAPPLHIGFLLDNSGSMDMDMKDVQTAAVKFLNQNQHAVDVTLVDFDTEVRVGRYGPNDYTRMIERIRSRKPKGWTAFYDALGVYLDGSLNQNGQKVLVIYTDGGDTRSSITGSEVADLLKASDVTVYAIGYLEHQGSSTKTNSRMELQRFAALTGGQAFFPTSIKEIDSMYEKIQNEIEARYTLGYTSSDEKMDGAWRQVEVKLKRPDLKGVKIRTRAGYFTPFKEGSNR